MLGAILFQTEMLNTDWRRVFPDYRQCTAPSIHRSFTVFKDLQCITMQHIAFNAIRGTHGCATISGEVVDER